MPVDLSTHVDKLGMCLALPEEPKPLKRLW
jgi:hypothetical protein